MYCPTMCAGLNIGLFHFSLSFNPCFPAFYTTMPSNPIYHQLSHRECFYLLVISYHIIGMGLGVKRWRMSEFECSLSPDFCIYIVSTPILMLVFFTQKQAIFLTDARQHKLISRSVLHYTESLSFQFHTLVIRSSIFPSKFYSPAAAAGIPAYKPISTHHFTLIKNIEIKYF